MKITRIVKLTLKAEKIEDFEKFFAEHRATIAATAGCIEVEAYQEKTAPHVFYTISEWESEQDLENYRNSAFFLEIWPRVKEWFAGKAEAHTLKKIG